jgi:hypothetical protein
MPTLQLGHVYLLLISHFSGNNQSGYDLTFGGGTAVITDPVAPAMLTVRSNCAGQIIYLKLNKKMNAAALRRTEAISKYRHTGKCAGGDRSWLRQRL